MCCPQKKPRYAKYTYQTSGGTRDSTIDAETTTRVKPRYSDLRYNDIPGITINIRLPARRVIIKCMGAEPRYNDLPYNDVPGLTMGRSLTERKIFAVITTKSISQTTRNAKIVHNKTNVYYSRPSKKSNRFASFFQKFYGREEGFLFLFFDSEVLMLKYSKTYPYLLSFLYPSDQTYYIMHKHHIGTQKTQVFGQLFQTSTKVLSSQNSIETFLKNTMKIKNKKIFGLNKNYHRYFCQQS